MKANPLNPKNMYNDSQLNKEIYSYQTVNEVKGKGLVIVDPNGLK